MSIKQLVTTNFMRGLNDTPDEDGLAFPTWAQFHDQRVADGGTKRRKGMVRIARAGHGLKSLDLNGTSQYVTVPLDTRITAKMGTQFSIEGLISPDAVSGTNPIVEWGLTTSSFFVDTASSKLRVRIWDSAAALTTLTSTTDLPTTKTSFQVVRDGADLTLRLDGVSEDTDTMSATNALRTPAGDVRIGYDGTDYFNGQLDKFNILGVARSNHNDDRLRFPDPRAGYVLFAPNFDITSDGYCRDESRYGNTGLATGSPSAATALAIQTAPVSMIHAYQNDEGVRRVLVVAGELAYDGEV